MVNLTTVSLSSAATPPLEPGVSLQLAQWRAKQYRDIRYAVRIELLEGSNQLKGNLEIRVTTAQKPIDLVLDWRGAPVRDVRVNDVAVVPEVRNEHLVIGRKHLKGGTNTVQLAFESPVAVSGSAVTRYKDREDGSEYLPRTRARSSPASTNPT
jgi:aminopeptidase N